MFVITKPLMYDRKFYVTKILRGGLSIDNHTYDPNDRYNVAQAIARKFKTLAAAEKALQSMRDVGGFDGYQIEQIDD